MSSVDPVGKFNLSISKAHKVATAGSCFAQHIARHLSKSGFNYYIAEPGHPMMREDFRARHGYGTFSARYGNIYTSLQLRQLVDRAYGTFLPAEGPWIDPDGTVRDPFRPTVQPGNFINVEEMEIDRDIHLSTVRKMFEHLDVFVFTLGLTECWRSREDGAAFPLCPGVEGGSFDELRYVFHNETVGEVCENLDHVVSLLKRVNPKAQVVLTVSPVPLMATAEDQAHVLTATTYSKSVLRVAAEQTMRRYENVHYFPSYEVITGSFNRGSYYADDLRNVTEDGVSHVMRLFLKHATEANEAPVIEEVRESAHSAFERASAKFVEVECDEAALDRP